MSKRILVMEDEKDATCWQKYVSTCSNRSRIAGSTLSAFGTKRTFRDRVSMSAFGGKTDIVRTYSDVCF